MRGQQVALPFKNPKSKAKKQKGHSKIKVANHTTPDPKNPEKITASWP